jgi:hypothetical protein
MKIRVSGDADMPLSAEDRNNGQYRSQETEALALCPFCGWEAHIVSGGPGNHFVQCKGCRATSDDMSMERAIAAWNRRPPTNQEHGEG